MTRPLEWKLRTRSLSYANRPLIMGVLNVTPDSFSDGGRFPDPGAAVEFGNHMVAEGADIIDVGGESTRPGAHPVSADEELRRVIPVVEELAGIGAVVSIDTSKPEIARAAIASGAEVINDVTGLRDREMVDAVRDTGAGAVIMHMKGTPRTMKSEARYEDVVSEVASYLMDQAGMAVEAGVSRSRISVDPGIGFGKTVDHNLALLGELSLLVDTGFPVVLGASRKSFLGYLTGKDEPAARDQATAVTTTAAALAGVACVRVHNVPATTEALAVASAIVRARR